MKANKLFRLRSRKTFVHAKGAQQRKLREAVAIVFEAMEKRQMLSGTAFSYTGNIQTYTVPTTGVYELVVAGAQGGSATGGTGGLGAVLSGEVTLIGGTVLEIVVGGTGANGHASGVDAAGGGGGSFVYINNAPEPLVVAGGGGGSGSFQDAGGNASTGVNGSKGSGDLPGAGGVNGLGGDGGGFATGDGGGGGGWTGDGGGAFENSGSGNTGGLGGSGFGVLRLSPPFLGGVGEDAIGGFGGGGGGGGGGNNGGGGGGGGYSGGGSGSGDGYGGGGGGSYFGAPDLDTSIALTETGNGLVSITILGSWMATLPDSTPLTEISLPGTFQSAAGPSVQDALFGSGSSSITPPTTSLTAGLNDASLAAHLAATTSAITAISAGGKNSLANGAATTTAGAALLADSAAGITGTSSGAALALTLTSDITGVASAIVSARVAGDAADETTADTAVTTDDAAVTADDTAAGAANTTAGTDSGAAATADTAAGTADTAAGTADTAAGTADTASEGGDVAAEAADAAAIVVDIVAEAEGGIDPVADGVAAAADGTGAGLDGTADGLNIASAVANGAADAANGTAEGADATAEAANTTAAASDLATAAPDTAADATNATADTDFGAAATIHGKAGVNDGLAAAALVAGAAADAYASSSFTSFVTGQSTPNTTGGNTNNSALQTQINKDALAEASTHGIASAAETVAAAADSVATGLNATAAALDTAAANALAAATAANEEADAANKAAAAADAAAQVDEVASVTDEVAATTADSADLTEEGVVEGLETAAATADGVAAAGNIAAAAADTTAIALDITAAATVEIPFVDIGTAAAAAIADGVMAGLDVTSDAADTADEVADGLSDTAELVGNGLEATAIAADDAAAPIIGTAAADEAIAVTDDAEAATLDAEASTADAAAVAACKAADAANKAADDADNTANGLNAAALVASAASGAADVTFTIETTSVQATQNSLQTQTLNIADQLTAGIRSLDLQGAQVNDTINLNAGNYFTGTTLQDALNDMTSYLQTNPSETILVTLGNEGPSMGANANSFNTDLNTLLNTSNTSVPGSTYKDFVYYSSNSSTTPTLGEVRGKIVFIPNTDQTWTPAADPATSLQIGWQPAQVVQNSHTITDPASRWNYAENDNGANDNGLIPTDLGTPSKLYTNDLASDDVPAAGVTPESSPIESGDQVNTIASGYFGSVKVTRTTGIVGMVDPAPTQSDGSNDDSLINDIINQNNSPIIVTSDSDAAGATGTLRDAITQANSQIGFNTIEFAPVLTGSSGNTIILQSDLPQVTNDLDVVGSVFINLNGHQGIQAASTHVVTETDDVASGDPTITPTTSMNTVPVYLNVSGLLNASQPVALKPVNIDYGTALDNSQLQGTATYPSVGVVPGTFTFTSAAGSTLTAGNGQTEAVTFTPDDTADFATLSATVIVNVAKATPNISGLSAADITYGTALANSQLSGTATSSVDGASATVAGAFVYNSAGSIPKAGNAQSENVTFTPTDTADYRSVTLHVQVNVAQASPSVTVDPVSITAPGTILNNYQLSGTAMFTVGGSMVSVPGAFAYTTAAGTVASIGDGQIESVTFTPNDSRDYQMVVTNVTVNDDATQVTPTVSVNPVNIGYGTALANSQLTGTANFVADGNTVNVPGDFSYTTALNTVLGAGNGQTEAVTFTPDDTTDYATVSTNVTVNVAMASSNPNANVPVVAIAGVNPVNITYGTALANTQLSGTATVTSGGNTMTIPGTFNYTSAAGTILHAGDGQTEHVTFTPTDTKDYSQAFGSVTVNVAKAMVAVGSVTQVISQSNTAPTNAAYGLLATTPLPTDTSISLKSGKGASTSYPLNVSYTVLRDGSTSTLGALVKGDALTLTLAPDGTVVAIDAHSQSQSASQSNQIYITYGTPLANNQLSGTASTTGPNPVPVSGAFSYTSAAGTVLNAGNGQTEGVTFTPSDTADYTTATATVTVNVAPAVPTVTVSDAGGIYTASPFPATGTITGVGGANLGTPIFKYYLATDTTFASPLPGAPTDVGNYVAVAISPASGNYAVGAAKISFTITPAATASAIAADVNPAVYGQQITYTATVTNASGTPAVPVGSVQFVVDGVNSGSPVSLNAGAQASYSIDFLSGASHSIQSVYIPTPNFIPSSSTPLTQSVQSILIEGTALYIGSNGPTSGDNVQLNPIGRSTTGSTGVRLQTALNGVNTNTNYSQVFSSVHIYLQNGYDNIHLNNSLTLSAVISGGGGNDQVSAGNGAITVVLGTGNDIVQLGNGNDVITLGAHGGTLNDNVTVGNGNNVITLLNTSGNAQIQAGNGANTISGATDNANISVRLGTGSNTVMLGNGNDSVQATQTGNGNNIVVLGSGNDSVQLGNGNNQITLGAAGGTLNDSVTVGKGNNTITLLNTTGNAQVTAGNGANLVNAAADNGNDTVHLGSGNNTVSLGNGNDSVTAGSGANTIVAGSGNDNVQLGSGSNNSVSLGNGNDTVQIGNGSNEIVAVGNGNDNITLGNGSFDVITIGSGIDNVQIGAGSNNTVNDPVIANPKTKIKFGTGTNNKTN